MELSDPLTKINGIGDAMASKFAKLDLTNIAQLIEYYPKSYDDYSKIIDISKLKPGKVSIRAKITSVNGRYVRRGMHITEAIASDSSGSVRIVWFNQPYRAQSIIKNKFYLISGNFELKYQKFSIQNPSSELESDIPVNTARILPRYKETKGLKSNQIRKAINQILPLIDALPETLPSWLISDNKLVNRNKAVRLIHYPSSNEDIDKAKDRLGFEEVFELTLTALIIKNSNAQLNAPEIKFDEKMAKDFVKHLAFKLTDDQKKVIWTIYQDLEKSQPMNRLIEGDVGSGKTVVAVMSALMAIKHGYQVALMAPTEILARQHAETIYNLLKPLGLENRIGLLLGKFTASKKTNAQKRIKSGEIQFLIGTQSLIQEKVDIKNLGLIIIDEQHRFGVDQRKTLIAKSGIMPHVLTMTATPIPRSLALTLYGEMDISIIKQKPSKRLEVQTEIWSPNSRETLYKKIDGQLDKGHQMFVVCPLVSDSDSLTGVKSVEVTHQELSHGHFANRKLGLLHGKLKTEEKNKVMQDFIDKKYDILVTTTVIEVGVDVPNANIMLIESAERFGLAQLHQLRGRVGRGSEQAYCYLMQSDSKAPGRRLRAIEGTNNGFKLSELDLEIRGPGAIYGTFQHGALDLSIASLTDTELIYRARTSAQEFIKRDEKLVQYKHLSDRINKLSAITSLN